MPAVKPQIGLLFLRSRGLLSQGSFVVVSALTAAFAVAELDGVPLSAARSVLRLSWLACLPGVMVAGFAAPPGDMELRAPRRPLARWRLVWFGGLLLIPVALCLAFHPGQARLEGVWFIRNHAFMLSLSMLAARLLRPAAAWLPGTWYLLLCWFLGTKDGFGTPWWWALPGQGPYEPVAGAVTIAMTLAAAWCTASAPARTGD